MTSCKIANVIIYESAEKYFPRPQNKWYFAKILSSFISKQEGEDAFEP